MEIGDWRSGIHTQLDHAGLPHHTITDDALHLILRVSEGVLRSVRNLCVGALIEAVRDHDQQNQHKLGKEPQDACIPS